MSSLINLRLLLVVLILIVFENSEVLGGRDLTQMQDEIMKRHYESSFDFVKLQLGVCRTLVCGLFFGVDQMQDMITDIARKWSKIMGADVSTFMFPLEKGKDTLEADQKLVQESNNYKHEQDNLVWKAKRTSLARKIRGKTTRTNPIFDPSNDAADHPKERSDVKIKNASGTMMSEAIQRKCKNVTTKMQRRIDEEGLQITPLLYGLWTRTDSPGSSCENSLLDLRKIELRVDRLEYSGVMDFIADVQAMLKGGMQYFGYSNEVRSEARKVHDLFFDVMKIAFPHTDFREAMSALTFSSVMAPSSPRGLLPIGQTKRPTRMVDPVK